MSINLTKKDIIAMNQEFDNGHVINEASLDFALSYAKRTTNWTKALALLVRAILIDHVFEEGNKRTVAMLMVYCIEYEGHDTYDDKITNSIKQILVKNITNISKIEELIKNAIK